MLLLLIVNILVHTYSKETLHSQIIKNQNQY